jgi:hypothetical protein
MQMDAEDDGDPFYKPPGMVKATPAQPEALNEPPTPDPSGPVPTSLQDD